MIMFVVFFNLFLLGKSLKFTFSFKKLSIFKNHSFQNMCLLKGFKVVIMFFCFKIFVRIKTKNVDF